MNYEKIWKKVLGTDEKIEYEFSIGERYLKIGLVVLTVISVLMMFIEVYSATMLLLSVWFFFGFYFRVANAYALTNKRILIHRGWLSTNLTSIDYSKITDINVGEPFFERIITHTGHLSINTAGTSQEEVFLSSIEKPHEVKKKIDILKDKNR
ncbi:MAG: PH domain-containing protein [Patescibacteria group bacterium]|jgi:uncharacterized membrane protein YdbT with pleckstrin-like domain|nr:PH domain-containing protein [Patescibacteria group bacterium]